MIDAAIDSIIRSQHQVTNRTGDGHVEPHRENPTSHFAVLVKLAREGVNPRLQNERQADRRQYDVADQKNEIDGSNRAFAAKFSFSRREMVRHVA